MMNFDNFLGGCRALLEQLAKVPPLNLALFALILGLVLMLVMQVGNGQGFAPHDAAHDSLTDSFPVAGADAPGPGP